MQTREQASDMAMRLRQSLQQRHIAVDADEALDLVARQLGYDSWTAAATALPAAPPHGTAPSPAAIQFSDTIPILRMFDEAKAREFFCGFLGFTVNFEHRFSPDLPLYMEIARGGMRLHLSEHHGDASPGATIFVPTQNVRALHSELAAKQYGYGRPGIQNMPWGEVLEVHDPFGNRIRFCQQKHD